MCTETLTTGGERVEVHGRSPRVVSRRRLALTALAALVVLAISIVAGSSVISSPSTNPPAGRAPTGAAPAPANAFPPALPSGFVTFEDPERGFSIAYPGTWTRLNPSDKEVRLLVADGTKMSLLIRVAPVGLPVTRETLGLVRNLTDSLIGADRGVKLLAEPAPITLDGLPGYRYLYTFAAGRDGRRGAHVHYFLFRRQRLITLVFQLPGVSALERNSALLDRVAGTFRAAQ